MRRTAMPLAVAAAVLGLAGDGGADEAYRATVKKWRDERQARLKADGGWLSVAGLAWLKPGENRFGTDKAAAVVLPLGSAPAFAGVFELKGTETTVRLAEGTLARMAGLPLAGPAVLRPDSGDVVELGSVSLQVIERGGRVGLRLKDKKAAARPEFPRSPPPSGSPRARGGAGRSPPLPAASCTRTCRRPVGSCSTSTRRTTRPAP